MAAVHFTTIPCELNITKETNHRHKFYEIRPDTNNIVYVSFEVFITDFSARFCQRVWCFRGLGITDRCANVLVAIFFSTVDQSWTYLTEVSRQLDS